MRGSRSLVIWEHGVKRRKRFLMDDHHSEGACGVLVWVQCGIDGRTVSK